MVAKRYFMLVALLMAISSLGIHQARADTSLDLTGTRWKATWTDPALSLSWDAEKKVLTKRMTFTTLGPVSIVFEQVSVIFDEGQPDLFFTLDDSAFNETGFDWCTFRLELLDLTPEITINHDGPTKRHPAFPHFHVKLKPPHAEFSPLDLVDGGESKNFIELGSKGKECKKVVPTDGTLRGENINIHIWEFEGHDPAADTAKKRKVELRQSPPRT